MATLIPSEVYERLVALARPLTDEAMAAAPAFTLVSPEASPELAEAATAVQAVVVSFEAVLRTMKMSEFHIATALGAVCGTIIAQAESDPKMLFRVFSTQMSSSLEELTEMLRPKGTA